MDTVNVRFLNRLNTKPNIHEWSHLAWELPSKTEGKIEGRIEVTRRRVRRHKQLPDTLRKRGEDRKLKEEALDRTPCRTGFGRGCGMNDE